MVEAARPLRARTFEGLDIRSLRLPLVEVVLGTAVFVTALFAYNATLTPSLSYESFDGNELATVPYRLGLAHMTGYPLYTWLGKLFTYLPVGDVAHRMNLMSAVGAAGGAAFLFGIVTLLTRENGSPFSTRTTLFGAAVGALLFAFATTIWSQAVIAEVYAPNLFFVGLTFLLLITWARREEARIERAGADAGSLGLFGLFALSYGLSIGTHMSNLAFAPAFVLFILLTNPRTLLQPKLIALGAAGFALGVLQFVWLPYKASQIDDALMARNAPDTLRGFYNYTLNAFPNFKWAFPIAALPDRITLYIGLILENFRLAGALLALAGAWAMVFRQPKVFFLLIAAYLTELAFFLEYSAFDIEVFFVSAHLITAVFAGYGAWWLAEASIGLGRRLGRKGLALPVLVIGVVALQPVTSMARYWDENDQSKNTGINDFYEVVFDRLPRDSVLVGRGGVFGYDMLYFRYVYDVRPDVLMPHADTARPQPIPPGRPVFTNVLQNAGIRGPGALPPGSLPANAWYWPVVASPVSLDQVSLASRDLTLYEVKETPPTLFVNDASPAKRVDHDFGEVTLVGYEVTPSVEAGSTVHLKLYWQSDRPSGRYFVSTEVGDTGYVETHELGFGNLQRYLQTYGQPPTGSLLVDEYDLVVLSSLEPGKAPLRVRISSGPFAQDRSEWLQIDTIVVR